MTPLEILKDVVTVAEALYQQDNFVMALKALQSQILETSIFLETMLHMSYTERLFRAGRHQSKIDGHRSDLLELIPILNLGLTAQQLTDKALDHQNELADRAAFIQEQEAQLIQRQAQHFKQRQDLEAVMHQQMNAFKEDLQRHWQPEPRQDTPPLPEQFMVKLYDITFEEKLTSSRLGTIHRGHWKGQPVLVKGIEGPLTPLEKNQFIREAQIMSRLHHDNIVPFYGACFDTDRMCIVTGMVDSPDRLPHLTLAERLTVGKDLATGLQYLHQNEVIHNDIHPENIGLTKHNEGKWLDLSWVKTTLSSLASVGVAHDISVWQAPEIWEHRDKVSPESDVYSFGWLLWTFVSGKQPFSSQAGPSLYQQIKGGAREAIPIDCPESLSALITRCWDPDPKRRPALPEVIQTLSEALLSTQKPASPTGEAHYAEGKAAQQSGDHTSAFAHYTRSAAKQYTKSYNSLGFFALEGLGGQAKDPQKAKTYFEQAAEGGYAPAMYNLGRMYEKGSMSDSASHLDSALNWYRKAHEREPNEVRYKTKVETMGNLRK